jgi:hypothetical protein
MTICVSPLTISTRVGQANSVDVVVYTPSASALPSCANGDFVLVDPQEFATISANPFALDLAGAAQISVAIAGVWAVAWVFRALIKAMAIDREENENA